MTGVKIKETGRLPTGPKPKTGRGTITQPATHTTIEPKWRHPMSDYLEDRVTRLEENQTRLNQEVSQLNRFKDDVRIDRGKTDLRLLKAETMLDLKLDLNIGMFAGFLAVVVITLAVAITANIIARHPTPAPELSSSVGVTTP